MIWMSTVRLALASLVALALPLGPTSCGNGSCADDLAGWWESVAEYECPLVDPVADPAADPECTYRYSLRFDEEGTYEWIPGDYSIQGDFTCESGMVEAIGYGGNSAFTAVYDPEAETLELDEGSGVSEPYRRAP